MKSWILAGLVVAAVGCRTAGETRKDSTERGAQGSVRIDPKIREACGNVADPHFEFDSKQVSPDAAERLDRLVECFNNGSLKGKSLKLIGHTDAVGSAGYNQELGKERAQSVASYLTSKGIDGGRLAVESHGEQGAKDGEAQGWAADRVVDIDLVEP
jgi:outer membrane protein OmpA-like peptidoglycan-associated protein